MCDSGQKSQEAYKYCIYWGVSQSLIVWFNSVTGVRTSPCVPGGALFVDPIKLTCSSWDLLPDWYLSVFLLHLGNGSFSKAVSKPIPWDSSLLSWAQISWLPCEHVQYLDTSNASQAKDGKWYTSNPPSSPVRLGQ